jgi:glycerol-3-phosphate dehydrogenase (NAD(P)+)
MLWSRRSELADEINSLHTNSAYLGATALPDALRASSDLQTALAQADVVAMAVPSQGFHEVMNEVSKYVRSGVPVVSLSKGLEQGTFLRMSEVIEQIMPNSLSFP